MTWRAIPISLLFIPLLLEGTIKRLLAGLISVCMQRECIYAKKTKSPVWDIEIIKSSSKKGLEEEEAWEGSRVARSWSEDSQAAGVVAAPQRQLYL